MANVARMTTKKQQHGCRMMQQGAIENLAPLIIGFLIQQACSFWVRVKWQDSVSSSVHRHNGQGQLKQNHFHFFARSLQSANL